MAAAGVTGRIEIRDLRVTAICGVLEEERTRPQPLSMDVDVWIDMGAAAASDALGDTADYGALVDAAARTAASSSFQLLEALATRVAAVLLESDRRIHRVEAAVRKLRPPVPFDLASAGVRVTLDRDG